MGQKLSTSTLENTPVVNLREAKNQYFIGTLKGYRQQKSGYKNDAGEENSYDIYEFAVEDSDMGFQKKEGKEYKETTVREGELVSVFAPTRLHTALKQAANGSLIKFVALGKGKANARGGRAYEFEVEVL